jgi:hypothetical protein
MKKSLDEKLTRIHADPQRAKDFILADAKDADMALGLGATGRSPEAQRYRSLQEFRDQIEQLVTQGLIDIMLMSAHANEVLTIQKRIFEHSHVTPAARANDTTDIHVMRGGRSPTQPALPFRTATLDHIQCGHMDCADSERVRGANLGSAQINSEQIDDKRP